MDFKITWKRHDLQTTNVSSLALITSLVNAVAAMYMTKWISLLRLNAAHGVYDQSYCYI